MPIAQAWVSQWYNAGNSTEPSISYIRDETHRVVKGFVFDEVLWWRAGKRSREGSVDALKKLEILICSYPTIFSIGALAHQNP